MDITAKNYVAVEIAKMLLSSHPDLFEKEDDKRNELIDGALRLLKDIRVAMDIRCDNSFLDGLGEN